MNSPFKEEIVVLSAEEQKQIDEEENYEMDEAFEHAEELAEKLQKQIDNAIFQTIRKFIKNNAMESPEILEEALLIHLEYEECGADMIENMQDTIKLAFAPFHTN